MGAAPSFRRFCGRPADDKRYASHVLAADLVLPTPPTLARVIYHITLQAKAKYDRYANSVAHDGLALISPTAFDAVRREGISRKDLQKTLYETIQLPGNLVFDGRERGGGLFPQWVKEKHKTEDRAGPDIFQTGRLKNLRYRRSRA